MGKFELIKKGFEFLMKDCANVSLSGIVKKSEIPQKATREDYESDEFDHEYNYTRNDGWDQGDFWGSIYLSFIEDEYMHFEVSA